MLHVKQNIPKEPIGFQHDVALADWKALYGDAGLTITARIPVPDTFAAFLIEGRRIGEA